MGDLFAPVYQAGNQASMQAANDWQNRVFNVNSQNIEQTRKPASFNTGNPGGMLDPEALRVLAQGGPYDFNARRNAIAAAAQQQQPAAPAAPASPDINTLLAQMSPSDMITWQAAMNAAGRSNEIPAQYRLGTAQYSGSTPAASQPTTQPPIYSTNSDGYQQAFYPPSSQAIYSTNSDGYQQVFDPAYQGPVYQPTS
jgi:hypothetical protein